MTEKSIVMLFAPKFRGFGCEVAKAFMAQCGATAVHALCTGGSTVKDRVVAELGGSLGQVHMLDQLERQWLSVAADRDLLARLDDELGPGAFGKIVVADQRIGRGFLRGGLARPNPLGDRALRDPIHTPERYVAGLYAFLSRLFEETRPDLVFCYAVAGAPAVALGEFCARRKVPFTRISTSRIGTKFLVDTDPAGNLRPVVARYERALSGEGAIPQEIMTQARTFLADYRDRPVPPEYMLWTHGLAKGKSPIRETGRISTLMGRNLIRMAVKGKRDTLALRRNLFEIRKIWRRERQLKAFAKQIPDDSEFIFYPLHVDPEASTTVAAPFHTNQIAVIEALAKSAPGRMRVIVKEHAPMVGRRPRGFYETIAAVPRVVLLSPEHPSLKLIQRAAVTAVITGTAAWEAICLGRRAVVIGSAAYAAIGEGIVLESNLARLPEAIARALEMAPAPDHKLETYIGAIMAESFEMPTSLLWGDYDSHPAETQRECSAQIAKYLLERSGIVPVRTTDSGEH